MSGSTEEFFLRELPALLAGFAKDLPEEASGSVVVSVLDVGQWFIRAERQGVQSGVGKPTDCLVELCLRESDLEALLIEPAKSWVTQGLSLATRPLLLDAARAEAIRAQSGTLQFVVTGPGERSIWLTPGSHAPNLQAPRCRLECAEQDFVDLRSGKTNPMELFLNGRIRSAGDLELPLALLPLMV